VKKAEWILWKSRKKYCTLKYFSDRTLCSGTFPLWKKEGEMFDCVLVSGLTHEKDP
jgi:uncharacterized protein (UPF0303 family)